MSRRSEVLAALRSAEDAVSGEVLARGLGVSRAAVAKHVAALRADGYSIEADPGSGYRFLYAPDLPLPAEVSPLLKDPTWFRLGGQAVTASTNEDAKRSARAGAPEGTVVLAGEQTAGRGRLGRDWSSPSGGVYLSIVLRPPVALADVPPLALAVALGVCRGLEKLDVSPGLKWPNDVLLDGGKLVGVLLETSAEADRAEWVVAGCGINVRRPSEPFSGAAYLRDVTSAGTASIAATVLDGIASAYRDFVEGGFSSLCTEYEQRHVLTGRSVAVRDASGGIIADGTVSGVDESGRLVVEGDRRPTAVSAGEVTLR